MKLCLILVLLSAVLVCSLPLDGSALEHIRPGLMVYRAYGRPGVARSLTSPENAVEGSGKLETEQDDDEEAEDKEEQISSEEHTLVNQNEDKVGGEEMLANSSAEAVDALSLERAEESAEDELPAGDNSVGMSVEEIDDDNVDGASEEEGLKAELESHGFGGPEVVNPVEVMPLFAEDKADITTEPAEEVEGEIAEALPESETEKDVQVVEPLLGAVGAVDTKSEPTAVTGTNTQATAESPVVDVVSINVLEPVEAAVAPAEEPLVLTAVEPETAVAETASAESDAGAQLGLLVEEPSPESEERAAANVTASSSEEPLVELSNLIPAAVIREETQETSGEVAEPDPEEILPAQAAESAPEEILPGEAGATEEIFPTQAGEPVPEEILPAEVAEPAHQEILVMIEPEPSSAAEADVVTALEDVQASEVTSGPEDVYEAAPEADTVDEPVSENTSPSETSPQGIDVSATKIAPVIEDEAAAVEPHEEAEEKPTDDLLNLLL